jgi:hypothetical protein
MCASNDVILVTDCRGLSRRRCQRYSDCYYDKYAQSCDSIHPSIEYDDETYRDDFDDYYSEYDPYEYDDELYQEDLGDDYSDYDPYDYDYRA